MLGILFLIMCITVGYMTITLALPSLFTLFETTYTGKKIKFPSVFFIFSASSVLGIMLLGWISYISAYILQKQAHSVKLGSLISLGIAVVYVIVAVIIKRKRILEDLKGLFRGFNQADGILFALVIILISYLMFLTFSYSHEKLFIGSSVFSDFSPHIGMIQSFTYGDNVPTKYSHFAGEDIKYHFMFQYFVAILQVLGLRLDFAFNIPSILCLVCTCMLLYSLAVKLFSKRGVGLLAVGFFLFRSSQAFLDYLADIRGGLKEQMDALLENVGFIGKTLHEDWGLWNLNVYVNQRHLALGLCLVIISVTIMLQYYFDGAKRYAKRAAECADKSAFGNAMCFFETTFLKKKGYFTRDINTPVFVGLLLGMGAFFNGACVIAALLILCFIAMLSDGRFSFLLLAVLAVGLSFIQSKCFITGSALAFRYEPGFLADNPTFASITKYLMALLGIAPFMLLAAFLSVNGFYKWLLWTFFTPIVFAVTCQMTPDVAVNHKYIMISYMMLTVFLGAIIYKIFVKRGLASKIAAVILTVMLTITGIYDLTIVVKKNVEPTGGSIVLVEDSYITQWIRDNATSEDIFLTDWYSINEVVNGGAMLYYGWPYYAWSAGYDTDAREQQVRLMYSAPNSELLDVLVKKNNIRFIIVERENRLSNNYDVNEEVIAETYGVAYTEGEGEWKFTIYDTKQLLN